MSENSYERYTFSHDLSLIFGKSRVKMGNVRNSFLTTELQILNSEPPRKRRRLNENTEEENRNKSKRKGFVRPLSGFFGFGS